jgi:hypothetical protein
VEQIRIENDLADLVKSFANARPEWQCPYALLSLFSYHRERSMAETLGFIRRYSGHIFEGESRCHPDESLSCLGFFANSFILYVNVAVDQLCNLASIFYQELLKQNVENSDYCCTFRQFQKRLLNGRIDLLKLDKLLEAQESWIKDVINIRNLVIHKMYYTSVDGGPTDYSVSFWGKDHEKVTIQSIMLYSSGIYYRYCNFEKNFISLFKDYFIEKMDRFCFEKGRYYQSDSYFWKTLTYCYQLGENINPESLIKHGGA